MVSLFWKHPARGQEKTGCSACEVPPAAERRDVVCSLCEEDRGWAYDSPAARIRGASHNVEEARIGFGQVEGEALGYLSF
jgi:hypothetical protein